MELKHEKRDTGTLLLVSGRMDAVTAPEFERGCLEITDGGEKLLVVDLAGLEYISSAGLRSIIASAKKMKPAGASMVFCGLSGMVEEVFQVSGLQAMFTIAATADEAFAS